MNPGPLVSLGEAARIAERSPSTLRRWLSVGHLTRHEGEPPAHGGSAPVLVDRSELLAYLATSGQQPRVPSEQVQVSTAGDHAERDGLAVELARAEVERDALARERDRLAEDLERVRLDLADWRERHDARAAEVRELATQLRDAEVRAARAEAEAAAARGDAEAAEAARRAAEARAAAPWWRRLLGGPAGQLPG